MYNVSICGVIINIVVITGSLPYTNIFCFLNISSLYRFYAKEVGILENKEETANLTLEDWFYAVGRYNSPNQQQADDHAEGVYAYLEEIKVLLN